MRLIDADELLRRYDEEHKGPPGRARKLIEEAPTVSSSPEAHLLTLEEADEASHVWMEVLPHVLLGVREVRLVPVDTTACIVYTFGGSPTCYNACAYGTQWRCWSSKPTVEQMEKEKWEQ